MKHRLVLGTNKVPDKPVTSSVPGLTCSKFHHALFNRVFVVLYLTLEGEAEASIVIS